MSDAGVRRSSLSARGLWIDMLCIAAQADPIGYLTVKKVPLTVKDIARMVGESEPETETLIAELERNGVFSRDRNGTIFSRRIVRDVKKARTAQNNGKLGGNPSIGNKRGISASVNLQDNPSLKPHIPEASIQEKEKQDGAPDGDPPKVVPLRRYVFEGRVIRLEQPAYDRWKATYFAIFDFNAALQSADDYYGENPPKGGKWFFPVSRWLQKEHSAALERRNKAESRPDCSW